MAGHDVGHFRPAAGGPEDAVLSRRSREQKSDYDDVVTVIPSDKDTEHYAWLGALPGVREFLDERQVGEFSRVRVPDQEQDLGKHRRRGPPAIEDDQYGQVGCG